MPRFRLIGRLWAGKVAVDVPADAEVEIVLADIAAHAGRRQLGKFGVFLHGSRQLGRPRPDSDVDVIVLFDPAESAEAAALREEYDAMAGPGGILLDIEVVPADQFGADPWVPLSRARLVGGYDWRVDLGTPEFDAAARESINVFAAMIGYGDFDHADPSRVVKPLERLCSVLVILGRRLTPAGGSEAVAALADSDRLIEPVRSLSGRALSVLDLARTRLSPWRRSLRRGSASSSVRSSR